MKICHLKSFHPLDLIQLLQDPLKFLNGAPLQLCNLCNIYWAFLVAQMVKNLPASAGDIRNGGLIPGWGGSPIKGMATRSSWKISWTEEPGGLQSMGPQRVRHN